jgi:hypothetical protein
MGRHNPLKYVVILQRSQQIDFFQARRPYQPLSFLLLCTNLKTPGFVGMESERGI